MTSPHFGQQSEWSYWRWYVYGTAIALFISIPLLAISPELQFWAVSV